MKSVVLTKAQALVLTVTIIFLELPVQANENQYETIEAGDFVVSAMGEVEFGEELDIISDGFYTIRMKEGVVLTSDNIVVTKGVKATIVLENINIRSEYDSARVAEDSQVELVVPEETKSSLTSLYNAGIHIPSKSKLTISGKGELLVQTGDACAAIGASRYCEDKACGEIVIKEATVEANAHVGAAIGGIANTYSTRISGKSSGTITIESGTVLAKSQYGSGIGAGFGDNYTAAEGADVTVNGGYVEAGSSQGVGIGGGVSYLEGGNGGTLIVNGGEVNVSSQYSLAIGGGDANKIGGAGCDITVNGGKLTAISESGLRAVGGGSTNSVDGKTGDGGSLTVTDGEVIMRSQLEMDGTQAIGAGMGWTRNGQTFIGTKGKDPVVKVSPNAEKQIEVVKSDDSYNPEDAKQIEGVPFISENEIYGSISTGRYIGIKAVPREGNGNINVVTDKYTLGINGCQISSKSKGLRTVYTVADEIKGEKVISSGVVYSLSEFADESVLYVGSNHPYVRSFESTSKGKMPYNKWDNEVPSTTYAMTMLFSTRNPMEYSDEWRIRAYAQLSDGSYVYTEPVEYSFFSIADYLYTNCQMPTVEGHEYLYNDILTLVKPQYEKIEYK